MTANIKNLLSFETKRGYTLLFSVLIASLVLGVAVFILSVSRKQYILSATARESLYAVYASDSGIECGALDSNKTDWKTNTVPASFSCANNGEAGHPSLPISINFIVPPSNPYTDSNGDAHSSIYVDENSQPNSIEKEADFRVAFYDSQRGVYACAVISIIGYTDDTTLKDRTIIQSRGYNVCKVHADPTNKTWGPDTNSPRTVERARQLILGI